MRHTFEIFPGLLRRYGFSLTEFLVVIAVLSLILSAGWKLFFSGVHTSQHGQETIDHVRSAGLLFRSLENDFRSIVPWTVKTTNSKSANFPNLSTIDNSSEILFWTTFEGKIEQVRYKFAPLSRAVIREIVDSSGNTKRSENFGNGYFQSFLVIDPFNDWERFKVTVLLTGKFKASAFERVFSARSSHNDFAKFWTYEFLD